MLRIPRPIRTECRRSISSLLIAGLNILCLDRSAVHHNFGRAVCDVGGAESGGDDGIGVQEFCFFNHSVQRLLSGLGEYFGVFNDFSANEIAQPCEDVTTDMAGAHGGAANHTEGMRDLLTDNFR